MAIIVHPENPVNNLSLVDLKRIFLGYTLTFATGDRIVLTEYSRLKERFDRQVLKMSSQKVKKHWIRMVFSGKGAVPPRQFNELPELLEFVRKHRGAIGFVPYAEADTTVKIIQIEGKKTDETDYPLK